MAVDVDIRNIESILGLSTGNRTRQAFGRLFTASSRDDASSGKDILSISRSTRPLLRGMAASARAATEGAGAVEIADAGLREAENILHHMRDLAWKAVGRTVDSREMGHMDEAFRELGKGLDAVAAETEFLGARLLDGAARGEGGALVAELGTPSDSDPPAIRRFSVSSAALGLDSGSASLSTQEAARSAVEVVNSALEALDMMRGRLGAAQRTVKAFVGGVQETLENLAKGEGRIRSADEADGKVKQAEKQLLGAPESALKAQANQSPLTALSLLG